MGLFGLTIELLSERQSDFWVIFKIQWNLGILYYQIFIFRAHFFTTQIFWEFKVCFMRKCYIWAHFYRVFLVLYDGYWVIVSDIVWIKGHLASWSDSTCEMAVQTLAFGLIIMLWIAYDLLHFTILRLKSEHSLDLFQTLISIKSRESD